MALLVDGGGAFKLKEPKLGDDLEKLHNKSVDIIKSTTITISLADELSKLSLSEEIAQKNDHKTDELVTINEKSLKEELIKKRNENLENIFIRQREEALEKESSYEAAKHSYFFSNYHRDLFEVPQHISIATTSNDVESIPSVQDQLTPSNYIEKFQSLLWIEEANHVLEMRRYDMKDVTMKRVMRETMTRVMRETMMNEKYNQRYEYFHLDVPGLAEGRPSLMDGDKVRLSKGSLTTWGTIKNVGEKDIKIQTFPYGNKNPINLDEPPCDVEFHSSRVVFQRCHNGIKQYEAQPDIRETVFPNPSRPEPSSLIIFKPIVSELDEAMFPCYNENLNLFQRRAVINVLQAKSRPAPYVIFGPPGTGKTVTLVEAILQIYTRAKDFKILVCVNSNSCVDSLARRLDNSGVIKKRELVRLAAKYRLEKKMVPEDIRHITIVLDRFPIPSEARIIVTTCIQAGILYKNHEKYDYVFLDEAGHASEPEALIPIGLTNRGGCCVLAGDHRQLGPVIMSKLADKHDLGLSFLERITTGPMYQRNFEGKSGKDYNRRFITKLRICYRCDPRVMKISNKLFYDGDLECPNKTPEKWMELFEANGPLIFYPTQGYEQREPTNPSWFNMAEADNCISYVRRLYNSGLSPDQLGIVTPYRRQIDKIYFLFKLRNLPKCKVGTMEEFQGDEREVIIISTVRTQSKLIDFDKKFRLSFLFNPRRFNVALSRAKWLVIVIGDEKILSHDKYWSEYIEEADLKSHI